VEKRDQTLSKRYRGERKLTPIRSALDASGFLQVTSAQLERLARMFAESEAEFERAVGPEGSPKLYIEAYAHMLDVLGSASDTVAGIEAPATFRRTQQKCVRPQTKSRAIPSTCI
jgi:hypothetical protein